MLATPAPHGTLLALHHPPTPSPIVSTADLIELLDQHRLAEAVAGTDVRGITGGHLHYSTYSTFAGVPVSATCYTADPAPQGRFLSGVDGNRAITMLHVYDDRVVHTVVPLEAAAEVNNFPTEAAAQVEALTPLEPREMLSSKDSPSYAGA